MDKIYRYRNVDVDELSKADLVVAVKRCIEIIEDQKEREVTRSDMEMRKFFRDHATGVRT